MSELDIANLQSHLDDAKNQYISLLEELKSFFRVYRNSPEGRKHIYRVYSRSDMQGGSELKETWKIRLKMDARGLDSIAHVPDIVGVTIVCPFSSDADKVEALIRSDKFKSKFDILDEYKHSTYYEAAHFVVSVKGDDECRCEIQLKSMFHDAWSAKSHDLIYKPGGDFDKRFATQMGTLSTILSALETQSEIIREMVEEVVYFDKKKRDDARRRIIADLNREFNKIDSEEERNALADLQQYCNDNSLELSSCETQSDVGKKFRSMCTEAGNKYGYGRNLCRIFAAVAVSRDTQDMLISLHNMVMKWKARAHREKTYPAACPYHFFSLILYAFGQIERAIVEAEMGLKARGGIDPNDSLRTNAYIASVGATAHYYAERAWNLNKFGTERKKCESRALKLIAEARAQKPDDPSLLDTSGFIKITFAETEIEIEEGLEECRRSWSDCRDTPVKDVSDLFFRLHKRLAYRKILQIDIPDASA